VDSSQDEIGASAILAAQLDDELGGGAVQVTGSFDLSLSGPDNTVQIIFYQDALDYRIEQY
jgi:hypothetical protein